MTNRIDQSVVAHLAQQLRRADPTDGSRLRTAIDATLAAFPDLDAGTIERLRHVALIPPPEVQDNLHDSLERLFSGCRPIAVAEAMWWYGLDPERFDQIIAEIDRVQNLDWLG